jgi:hypothetical protein
MTRSCDGRKVNCETTDYNANGHLSTTHKPMNTLQPLLSQKRNVLRQLLRVMLVGWAALTAPAKDIPYHNLTLSLDADVTVQTNAESGWLIMSWGRPDGHWSPLFLMRCPTTQYSAKTNVQDQITQLAGTAAWMQMKIFKGLPTLKQLTAETNEVNFGSWKLTEVLLTAKYGDPDYGTMKYSCWFWAAGGEVWQAVLQEGSDQLIARARQIIGKIKLKPGKPPAARRDKGRTASRHAALSGHEAVVQILRQHGGCA